MSSGTASGRSKSPAREPARGRPADTRYAIVSRRYAGDEESGSVRVRERSTEPRYVQPQPQPQPVDPFRQYRQPGWGPFSNPWSNPNSVLRRSEDRY